VPFCNFLSLNTVGLECWICVVLKCSQTCGCAIMLLNSYAATWRMNMNLLRYAGYIYCYTCHCFVWVSTPIYFTSCHIHTCYFHLGTGYIVVATFFDELQYILLWCGARWPILNQGSNSSTCGLTVQGSILFFSTSSI